MGSIWSGTNVKVGIDDLNIAAGHRSLELGSLVAAGRHTHADLANAGFHRRSVLDVWEDPITLAAAAARPLITDTTKIGLLLVGTESGFDYGKPLSSYLHRVLALGQNCRNAEIKHACYGQTMALLLACACVRENPERQALVVGTDIPRHHPGPGELVAGLGAVAMTVSVNPRVLEVGYHSGCAAQETWDVARPTATVELADPILSLCAYLDAVEIARDDLRQSETLAVDDCAYVMYHCPLVSLVRQAHLALTG